MIYEYECPGDGQALLIERAIYDKEEEYDCNVCGTTLNRIFNAPGIHFKGGGWGGNHVQE